MPTVSSTKIVFFHLAYLYSGGGEKLALKEIELLQNQGYKVDCYAPLVNKNECFPDLLRKIEIKEIIPGFTKIFYKKPEIGVMLTCLLFPFVAWKYRKYDIAIGANQPGPIFGFILKILFRIPYIVYLAQPTRLIYPRPIDQKIGLKFKNNLRILPHIVNVLRPVFFWIDLKSIAKSDIFLCNGNYMQDILSHIYGRKPTACAAGAHFQEQTKDTYSQTVTKSEVLTLKNHTISKPYIFMSNRHFPHKKFEYALEILDAINNKIPLIISGETTEYTNQLKKLVTYYKLEKYVHFLGYVTENELETLYTNAAIYLYTAPEEDFGMGVIEAMGYGIPTIAWDNAGPSKVITDSYDGYLVNFNDKKKIIEIINKLLTDKSLYTTISSNAKMTVQNHYSWEKHIQIFEESIQAILNTKTAKSLSLEISTQND